jgi:hypothetical protein
VASNLRKSPTMGKALDKSQATIGVNRAARATENSSVVNRLSHGGMWNAARSPAAFSGTAIGMNELAKLPMADLVRMFQMMELRQ